MRELICLGEVTVDTIGCARRPAGGGSAAILESLGTYWGGRGANAAVFFSAGRPGATLLASAGHDFVASGQRDRLERRGVDCAEVLIEHERPTPRAFVFHEGAATRTFFYQAAAPAADRAFAEHVRRATERERARVVYCTSGRQDLNLHLLTHVAADLRVYAPGPQIFHYSAAELAEFLRAADALFLSEDEAAHLDRVLGVDAAEMNRALGLAWRVVTRGASGATLYDGTREVSRPACRADAEVDPTGAGDALAGAFLAEYLEHGDAPAALEAGLVAGSFVVEQAGCQERVPTRQQTRERRGEYAAGRRAHR